MRSRRLEPGIDRLARQWLDPKGQATAGHYDTATGNLNETGGKSNNAAQAVSGEEAVLTWAFEAKFR